jgi:molybdopterin-guanine dinucleotide biosynthesis protein B
MKVVAFSGPSNSGKTTLIVKIVDVLKATFNITVIKNDPKDKAVFDIKGKDSHKFYNSGADVIVSSPERTTHFSHQREKFENMLKMCKNSDFVFVEGLKYLDLPRIAIFREKVEESYIPYINAMAISNIKDIKKYDDIQILDLDDIDSIISWIYKNAKEIKNV